jgi:hypothetical protein
MEKRTTNHAVDVVRPRVKTYTERLTENTATLCTRGKLIKIMVEIAWNMALAHFRPTAALSSITSQKTGPQGSRRCMTIVASCEWEEVVWRDRASVSPKRKRGNGDSRLGRILVVDDP